MLQYPQALNELPIIPVEPSQPEVSLPGTSTPAPAIAGQDLFYILIALAVLKIMKS